MKNRIIIKSFVVPTIFAFMAMASCKQEAPALSITPDYRSILGFSDDGLTARSSVGDYFTPVYSVITNAAGWNVESDQSWLTVTDNKKDNTFRLTAIAAAEPSSVVAKVTVTAGAAPPIIITARGRIEAPEPEPEPEPEPVYVPTLSISPGYKVIVSFSDNGLTAQSNTGASFSPVYSVITDEPEWDAKSDQSWLTVTVNQKDKTFTLSANATAPSTAVAKVTITAGAAPPVNITAGRRSRNYPLAGSPETGGIVDVALVYTGLADGRLVWTQKDFQHFLTWINPDTKKEEWLFDSFCFLEIYSYGFQFANAGSNPATKVNMLKYLDEMLFVKNRLLESLDNVLGETIRRLGPPPRPRKVFFMIPDSPHEKWSWDIVSNWQWGELNGKPTDRNVRQDVHNINKWYIDQVMERWNKETYKNIELAGFYFLREDLGWQLNEYQVDIDIIGTIGQHVHGLGKRLIWCPHSWSNRRDTWKTLGIDVAYQQPNYFFYNDLPASRVQEACEYAERYGMSLENEWDLDILLSDLSYYSPVMKTYLDGFDQCGVWHYATVMHFMGGGTGMVGLSQSTDPRVVALYRQFCSILADRQKRFAIQ